MTSPLDDALAVTRTWLSHHYEVQEEKRGAHSAVVLARHLGNTPGTVAIAGEAFYVLVETLGSIDHEFAERQARLAQRVGKFGLVLPSSRANDSALNREFCSVIHSYGSPF